MIGRLWRGRATGDDTDGAEFITLTLFDSLDAVRAFAGEQYEAAVVAPAAQAVLRDFDRTVRHYTVAVAPPGRV